MCLIFIRYIHIIYLFPCPMSETKCVCSDAFAFFKNVAKCISQGRTSLIFNMHNISYSSWQCSSKWQCVISRCVTSSSQPLLYQRPFLYGQSSCGPASMRGVTIEIKVRSKSRSTHIMPLSPFIS